MPKKIVEQILIKFAQGYAFATDNALDSQYIENHLKEATQELRRMLIPEKEKCMCSENEYNGGWCDCGATEFNRAVKMMEEKFDAKTQGV